MSKNQKRIVLLKGKKVILRPPDKATDLETCTRWLNDQQLLKFLDHHHPVSIAAEEEWFDNLKNRPNDIVVAIETMDGQHIGNAGIHRINWRNRTASGGIFIGEKAFWGKGYGTETNMLMSQYAFNTLNLRKINACIIAFNERSLKSAMKCGAIVEGRQIKQHFTGGRYYDIVILGIFKKEWQAAWRKYLKSRC